MALGNIEAPESIYRVEPAEETAYLSDYEDDPPPTIFETSDTTGESFNDEPPTNEVLANDIRVTDAELLKDVGPAQAFFDESLQTTQQGTFPSTTVTNEPFTQGVAWPGLLQDAEYKLGVIRAKMDLLRQLAMRAANGGLNPEELEGIVKEANALIQELIDVNASILLNQTNPGKPNTKPDTPPIPPQLFPEFFTREGAFVLATAGVMNHPLRQIDVGSPNGALNAIKSVGQMIGNITDIQFAMVKARVDHRERGEASVTEQTAAAHGDRVTDIGIQIIEDMANLPWPYAGAQANLNPQHIVAIYRAGNGAGDIDLTGEGKQNYWYVKSL